MIWLFVAVGVLVLAGSSLALAEASISRMTAVRALALKEQGRRNGAILERIENDPARYLNSIYLCVMFAQNGSAVLVAFLAEHYLGGMAITWASIIFTLAYFVVVEAMSKTFAILHSDRVALALAPVVYLLGRTLSLPTRGLIGLANILLPGKGLAKGPFVSEEEIRSLADVGHEEGVIEEHEKEMIHSVFQFGDRVVVDLMVPRPDIVAIDLTESLEQAAGLIVKHGLTRIPVYRGELDHTEGIIHAKDVLNALNQGRDTAPLSAIMRPVDFVPEQKRAIDLLREMQQKKFHLAMVSDEYGSIAGLVTLEDLLEELVGEITDEHQREEDDIEHLTDGRYRVSAGVSIADLNDTLGSQLPHDRWNTVGGLVFGLLGTIPDAGATVDMDGFTFTAERVQGRRIVSVLVQRPDLPEA